MKVLITGISGFAGSHLAEYILAREPEVRIYGTLHSKNTENIKSIQSRLNLSFCDICDQSQIRKVISDALPDSIFHLAAQSYVHTSWENPQKTLFTNIIGQSNLFEAVREVGGSYSPAILIAGSSEEYGIFSNGDAPVGEGQSLCPNSPYGLSKVGQDLMGYQYWKAYKLRVIRMRAFNHTGPRRPNVFGISGFGHKIAQIEAGRIPPEITVRDLSAVRDFTDVRDVVRGYSLAMKHCAPGEVYNICSGKGTMIKNILDEFLQLSRVKNIKILPDPRGKRPNDGGKLIGDNSKFLQAAPWTLEYDFLKNTVPDILEYWRRHL